MTAVLTSANTAWVDVAFAAITLAGIAAVVVIDRWKSRR